MAGDALGGREVAVVFQHRGPGIVRHPQHDAGEDRVACDESNVKRGLNEIIMASPFRIAGL